MRRTWSERIELALKVGCIMGGLTLFWTLVGGDNGHPSSVLLAPLVGGAVGFFYGILLS